VRPLPDTNHFLQREMTGTTGDSSLSPEASLLQMDREAPGPFDSIQQEEKGPLAQ